MRQLRLQRPASAQAHRTKVITPSKGREGVDEVEGGIGVGGGHGGWNRIGGGSGDVNVDGDGDGAGRRTGIEVEKSTQDGNGDGSGEGIERMSGHGTGRGEEERNGDGIGEGGGETKKRKIPHKSSKRDVGNVGDLSGVRKTTRQESVGRVAAYPNNLESSKEAGREAQGTQGFSNNCLSRQSMSSLSRLI